jgi:hypothetical protein
VLPAPAARELAGGRRGVPGQDVPGQGDGIPLLGAAGCGVE